MRDPVLLRTVDLDPNGIEVSGRKRPLSEAGVASVIASVTELKVIKDEIIVREVKHQGGKLKLVAGLHRLEACRRMGRTVPAKVYDCTDEWADLMELDDNVSGAELTVLDTAVFLAERKRLFEKLHPDKKRGMAGVLARRGELTAENAVSSFAASAAEKLGIKPRQIYAIMAAAKALAPDEITRLRAAPRPVNLNDLTQIGKIERAPERYHVVGALSEGRAKSAGEARRQFAAENGSPKPAAKDPAEEAFKVLLGAWNRAPMAARKRFLFERAHDVWEAQNKGVPLDRWQEAEE